jgi:tRNA(fMet)-specific endonuclease VapC
MFVFDTDMLSYLIRPRPPQTLVARIDATGPSERFTTTITVAELMYGAHRSVRREHLLSEFARRLWPQLHILPFDFRAAEIYARVRSNLERQGEPLDVSDLMIASITMAHGFTLVTGNLRHFGRVDGLDAESWL